MARLMRRSGPILIYVLWILFALYPNPTLLTSSARRSLDPQVDAEAVRAWAADLPDDPALIEQQVLAEYVPYSVPWETHGVPWYFPTTREVVEQGGGDCQARMLVLASILEAKGIPYKLQASFDHIWVEYDNKIPNRMENDSIALMRNDGDGLRLQVPAEWDWRETWRIEKEYFWDYMPTSRKLMLFGGVAAIFFRRRWMRVLSRLRSRYAPAREVPGNI